MTNPQQKQALAPRRRSKTGEPAGKQVVLHELQGRAYLMLPPEIHQMVDKDGLEKLRAELEQQAFWLELRRGRHLVQLCLPVAVMVWPPEKGGRAGKTTAPRKGGARNRKDSP